MSTGRVPQDRVAALRQQFDESFAHVSSVVEGAFDTLLAVRCGDTQYAIRVTEITALVADVRITPVASPLRELLGIAGIRGVIVPVYDLAAMLGHGSGTMPRWLALAGADAPVGLAFAALDRHLRVPSDVLTAHAGADAQSHSREVVRLAGGGLPVIAIASMLETIASRVRSARDTRGQ